MNVTKIYAPPRLWCEFPDEGWFTALRLANRIKPGLLLWLWEKIRKSLYACSQYSVVLPWTAAQVLMCPDGTFRTHTSLRLNLNQAYLDFLIFGQRNKTVPAWCNLPIVTPQNHPTQGNSYHPQTSICQAVNETFSHRWSLPRMRSLPSAEMSTRLR